MESIELYHHHHHHHHHHHQQQQPGNKKHCGSGSVVVTKFRRVDVLFNFMGIYEFAVRTNQTAAERSSLSVPSNTTTLVRPDRVEALGVGRTVIR